MKDKINICYVINDHPDYIKLTLESIEFIKKFFRSKKHILSFYIISEESINLPDDIINIISPYKNIPLLWQRMYIPELLNVDKVIFLDSDTVTKTCISKLWNIDIGNKLLGLSPHYCTFSIQEMLDHYNLNNFSLYNEKKNLKQYYNCGVAIINCKLWRSIKAEKICLKYYNQIKSTPHWMNDEPTYNVCFSDLIFEIDDKWNHFPRGDYKRVYITHYYGTYNKDKPYHNEFAI